MSAKCNDCGHDLYANNLGEFYCHNCAKDKEISRLRDALEKIANDREACYLTIIAKEALKQEEK